MLCVPFSFGGFGQVACQKNDNKVRIIGTHILKGWSGQTLRFDQY